MAPGMMLPAERGEEPDAAPRDDWRLPAARAVDRRPQHVGVTRGTVLLGERVTMLLIGIGDHVSGNGRCS